MSLRTKRACAPPAPMALNAASAPSSAISVMATSNPLPARLTAMAAPMPRRAPVTIATGRSGLLMQRPPPQPSPAPSVAREGVVLYSSLPRSWSELVQSYLQMCADTQSLSCDGERRVERSGGREEARVYHVEIVVVPGAAVRVEHRRGGIG